MHCLRYVLALVFLSAVNGKRYEPKWESLDTRPMPEWFDEAKIGIFLHWGVYSVPSMGSEWFWNYWRALDPEQNAPYVEFMQRNYDAKYTYQEFAKDFTAELFNATQWALLFQDSGAKYVVITSKHHDGYTLWPSKQSYSWNAVDIGPRFDVIGKLSAAIRSKTSLKFGLFYSLYEWFNPIYLNDKQQQFKVQNYVNNRVHPELKDLVNMYLPDIVWSDGDWEADDKYWKSEEFVAWLYNESPVSEFVITNDRWGIGTAGKHGDFYNYADRFNPGVLQNHKWENAMALDKLSWGQRFDAALSELLTSEELIRVMVTTVSCGGNFLINVGPTKYGTIQPIFEERLRNMGSWLQINGEAIYASKPWIYQNDSLTPDIWYTFKKNAEAKVAYVYANVLEYPYENNEIVILPFGDNKQGLGEALLDVTLLGVESTKIEWHAKGSSLHINFPPKNHIDKVGLKYTWTFKITVCDDLRNEV